MQKHKLNKKKVKGKKNSSTELGVSTGKKSAIFLNIGRKKIKKHHRACKRSAKFLVFRHLEQQLLEDEQITKTIRATEVSTDRGTEKLTEADESASILVH